MEFIIFLSKLDKEILDLLIKANYIVEENKIECLINKDIKGLHNFEENKIIICTENAKRKTNYRSKKREPNKDNFCLLYTSPSPRDGTKSRMPSSA